MLLLGFLLFFIAFFGTRAVLKVSFCVLSHSAQGFVLQCLARWSSQSNTHNER